MFFFFVCFVLVFVHVFVFILGFGFLILFSVSWFALIFFVFFFLVNKLLYPKTSDGCQLTYSFFFSFSFFFFLQIIKNQTSKQTNRQADK